MVLSRQVTAQKDTLKRSPMFHSGNFIDPWEVDPELIDIRDIARGLANINRFVGQTYRPYTVSQHSYYVSRIVPPHLRLAGLLHDSPEFLTNDMPHHIKHGQGFLGMHFKSLESKVARAVELKFGLEAGELDDPEIKRADEIIFDFEWASLVVGEHGEFPIEPWVDESVAERVFLSTFNSYTALP